MPYWGHETDFPDNWNNDRCDRCVNYARADVQTASAISAPWSYLLHSPLSPVTFPNSPVLAENILQVQPEPFMTTPQPSFYRRRSSGGYLGKRHAKSPQALRHAQHSYASAQATFSPEARTADDSGFRVDPQFQVCSASLDAPVKQEFCNGTIALSSPGEQLSPILIPDQNGFCDDCLLHGNQRDSDWCTRKWLYGPYNVDSANDSSDHFAEEGYETVPGSATDDGNLSPPLAQYCKPDQPHSQHPLIPQCMPTMKSLAQNGVLMTPDSRIASPNHFLNSADTYTVSQDATSDVCPNDLVIKPIQALQEPEFAFDHFGLSSAQAQSFSEIFERQLEGLFKSVSDDFNNGVFKEEGRKMGIEFVLAYMQDIFCQPNFDDIPDHSRSSEYIEESS